MTDRVQGSLAVFDDLRRKGREAVKEGRLEEALELYAEALEWARAQGDSRLIDRAFCGRTSVAIELGEIEGSLSELRQVLVRNNDPENCFLAAYNLGRAYELGKANKKALFYARIARDRAEAIGSHEWIASAHNLIGNMLLAESFFEEACREYEEALQQLPVEPSVRRALILDNLGYSYFVQDRRNEGLRLLFQSLRMLRRFGASRYEIFPRLSLCFAYLEIGRYERAIRYGRRALRAAEALQDCESIKNALYLLGEAANLSNDTDGAELYFRRLQRDYYPEADYLPDFLLAIDVRKLIHLKA
ncbi:MAG TPA: tetratricopeptide repeat protein [Thermoanaerobaculia bacterium]|nr:tetratricopeptide repeat protein [Thermoanaerobaculia bacterium]